MSRKITKWVIGVSSVALFTGLLYVEGQLNLTNKAEANIENMGVPYDIRNNTQTSIKGQNTGFVGNEQDVNGLQNMSHDEKNQRETWINSLDWEKQEVTIVPKDTQPTQPTQTTKKLRTRRS
ncbi:hypothetical protein E0485_11545 [Paenibacillus albiflavus]|uniref:Uncharacterized protein n=1 Tax=Paenibacillus albiflavus TaxID=2545760 RepID=A0A4R4ED25_9BACL|nr:hypothetical protein [Paenibacillus albiflavus]TCZ77093.1 hypothetical protein E0485_11545 [Paenibacillus albiflavus]